ncbi:ceramidase domain-containing protein [Nocardioides piscis]|uniref:Ceramidase n=1 Tax=Nocardioides piscis TaxID=2714938 RepID=A0A6G7YGZ5_9ACTN|nr:ceramidase domain-containing protein [Nocardioides piscis]QIK76082.1 hypothetical protein G7071_12235 [Nocardioides piscis]
MSDVRHVQPVLVTSAVAVGAVGLLVLALAGDWLGPDVGRGANFCEAARDGLFKQPANTLSNAGFVVAGLFVAVHVSTSRPGVMTRRLGTVYACVVVLLGPASAAMHATQSGLGGHLDLLSMYLVAGFAAAYAWMRWARRGTPAFVAAYAALVVACQAVGLWGRPVPVVQHAGNLAFGTLLVTAVVLEVLLWRRGGARSDIRWGLAALATMLGALSIWIVSQRGWCDPHSWLQGHAVWHLLSALAAYLLYRLYSSTPLRTEQPT